MVVDGDDTSTTKPTFESGMRIANHYVECMPLGSIKPSIFSLQRLKAEPHIGDAVRTFQLTFYKNYYKRIGKFDEEKRKSFTSTLAREVYICLLFEGFLQSLHFRITCVSTPHSTNPQKCNSVPVYYPRYQKGLVVPSDKYSERVRKNVIVTQSRKIISFIF